MYRRDSRCFNPTRVNCFDRILWRQSQTPVKSSTLTLIPPLTGYSPRPSFFQITFGFFSLSPHSGRTVWSLESMMASPGPFPPEIIQRIVYYLTHGWIGADGPIGDNHTPTGTFRNWGRIGGCARYAIVDRTWQYAVEHETFAELQLDLARLAEAEAILNSVPRRQRCVRAIVLHVVLPPRPDTAPRRTETTDERRRNNHALQETFEAFVSALGRWTRPGPPVRLSLEAFAMTRGSGREAWVPDTMTHCSPLELEDPERVLRLGPVNAVTELDMKRNDLVGRPFSGAAVGALLATMPAAKEVSIGYLATKSHFRMRSGKNIRVHHGTRYKRKDISRPP